jgi:hypothetical protein
VTKRRSEMRSGLGLVQNQKVYDRPLNLCCAGKDIRRRRYVVERFADGWLGGGCSFRQKVGGGGGGVDTCLTCLIHALAPPLSLDPVLRGRAFDVINGVRGTPSMVCSFDKDLLLVK